MWRYHVLLGILCFTLLPFSTFANQTTPKPIKSEIKDEDKKPVLTGNPQIDYIHDPNLPWELRDYDMSNYPFYNRLPKEMYNFTCDNRHDGFYASIPHQCQVYHNCLFGKRYDFLCANFTAFDQTNFICHYASEVDCKHSEMYYDRNEALYKVATTTTAAPIIKIVYRDRPHPRLPGRRRPALRRTTPKPVDDYYYYYDDVETTESKKKDTKPTDYYYYDEITEKSTTTTTPRAPPRNKFPNLTRKRTRQGQQQSQQSSGARRRPGRRPGFRRRPGGLQSRRRRPGVKRPRRRKKTTTTTTTTTTTAAPEYYEYYDDDYYYYDDELAATSTTTTTTTEKPRRRNHIKRGRRPKKNGEETKQLSQNTRKYNGVPESRIAVQSTGSHPGPREGQPVRGRTGAPIGNAPFYDDNEYGAEELNVDGANATAGENVNTGANISTGVNSTLPNDTRGAETAPNEESGSLRRAQLLHPFGRRNT